MCSKLVSLKFGSGGMLFLGVVLLLTGLNINLQAMDDALLEELQGADPRVTENLVGARLRLDVAAAAKVLAGVAKSGDGDTDSSGSNGCGDRVSVGSHSTTTGIALGLVEGAELVRKHLFTRSIAGDSVGDSVAVSTSEDGELDRVNTAVRVSVGDALREATRSAPPAISPVGQGTDMVVAWQARVTPHGTHTNFVGMVSLAGFIVAPTPKVSRVASNSDRLASLVADTLTSGHAIGRDKVSVKSDYVGSADGSVPSDRS